MLTTLLDGVSAVSLTVTISMALTSAPKEMPFSLYLSSFDISPFSLVVATDVPALPFNAVCTAVEIGLSMSDVSSTLPRPTCSLVTPWGLDLSVA